MPKNKNNGASEQLPRFTIQMFDPLYTTIHMLAIRRGEKVYELVNKLLVLGAKEWSKTQPPEMRININSPNLAKARKLASQIK